METLYIQRLAELIESADYGHAAGVVHTLTDDGLADIRTNIEFMLDMLAQEQRQRSYGYRG